MTPPADLDLFGTPVLAGPAIPKMADFQVFPGSVFNTREGEWQDRKRQWEALGIRGELGRKARLTFNGPSARINTYYARNRGQEAAPEKSTSVFDPALTEVLYRWFSPRGGLILDPFAGGSVRGIVASLTGRKYYGIELRAEQVEENRRQAAAIVPNDPPVWIVGDSAAELPNAPDADFIFSCPPYGDLERYSDDPRDISTMTYETFTEAYANIISAAAARLRPNRFASFVVGDYRDPRGFYRGFIGDTTAAFRAAGLELHNSAILVNMVASASMRATRFFNAARKFVKTHQNVLVFIKGDPDAATADLEAAGGII